MRKNFFWVALTAIAMLFLLMTMAHAKAAHEPLAGHALCTAWSARLR